MLYVLLAVTLVGGTVGPLPAANATGQPSIQAVYPNPVAPDDAGEFVVLTVPEHLDLTDYELADGETRVSLPDAGPGTVRFSTHPNVTRDLVEGTVARLPDRLQLANRGERLRLVSGDETHDLVSYENAPEGAVLWPNSTRRWRPLAATDYSVVTASRGTVEAFVLPDAGGAPAQELASAERRLFLAGYTITSSSVAETVIRAQQRGVDVRVIFDADPVGGMAAAEMRVLDRLHRAGIDVRVLGGRRARYRFHHAKYAVIDDRALVTSENWKPAGTGGNASRGWGVVTNQSRIVTGLVATFRADRGWHDALDWATHRSTVDPREESPANDTYNPRVSPHTVSVNRTHLLLAPDNAESAVTSLLGDADRSIWIVQASVGGVTHPFIDASLDAARRGVSVRLLLGNAWYNRADNQAVAERLRQIATREGLDLEVRLVQPSNRFARLHAKGAVIDGKRVLLGSLNWNNNSVRHNREVALVLDGEAVATYFGRVIRADWRAGRWRVSVGVLLGCLVFALIAARRGAAIEFGT